MGTLPVMPSYYGSMPYDEGEQEVTIYPQHGRHHPIDVHNAIWWCHQQFHYKRVKVQWIDSDQQVHDDINRTSAEEKRPDLGDTAGPQDRQLPAGGSGQASEQV